MTDNSTKTEYILYMFTNSCYGCSLNDGTEFNKALDSFYKIPFEIAELNGENYHDTYISSMYPELLPAIETFREKINTLAKQNKIMPDIDQIKLARETIQKFHLKESYTLLAKPDKEQQERLNKSMFPKIRKDLKDYPEAIKKLANAFGITIHDALATYHLAETLANATRVASGKVDKQKALKYTNVQGVPLGLEILELKERGILDSDLKVKDTEAFASSKLITQFKFDNKTYDLGPAIRKQDELSPILIQSRTTRKL